MTCKQSCKNKINEFMGSNIKIKENKKIRKASKKKLVMP